MKYDPVQWYIFFLFFIFLFFCFSLGAYQQFKKHEKGTAITFFCIAIFIIIALLGMIKEYPYVPRNADKYGEPMPDPRY